MNNDLQGQDMIRWMDNNVDPPVEKHGTVLVALSVQYLVVDSEGRETFVMKKEAYADPRVKRKSRRSASRHEAEVPPCEGDGREPGLAEGRAPDSPDTGTLDSSGGEPSEGATL